MEKSCSFGKRMFSLLCLFVDLVVSHFGFEGKILVLIASVSGHSLPFTFDTNLTNFAQVFDNDWFLCKPLLYI